jgi:hypothetical protein
MVGCVLEAVREHQVAEVTSSFIQPVNKKTNFYR